MLTKTYLGNNEDGTPRFHYQHDGEPGTVVLLTGPIYGVVDADGTEVDVSEPVIELPEHMVGSVHHAIGLAHEERGHPDHLDPEFAPFVHECDHLCAQRTTKRG